ncbi:MAG: polysaccharide deacetylase family protein [Tepidiformaceae bacterium]
MAELTEIGRERGSETTTSDVFCSAVAGGLVLPVVALGGSPVHASAAICGLAFLLAAGVALLVRRVMGPSVSARLGGCVAIGSAAFLLHEATYPGSGFVVAALLGAGIGTFLPDQRAVHAASVAGALGLAAILLILAWQLGSGVAGRALFVVAAAAVGTSAKARTAVPRWERGAAGFLAVAALYGAFSFFWVGSTSPSAEWLGALTSHGPRDRNEVAITFDDGPDATYTLPIAAVLEQYGARGTFFEVGKAVLRNPEITRELVSRGHVVGNHSYNHGAFSYLNPHYGELSRTEDLFRDRLGVCPALFRPPHGTHTPLMSRVVTEAGMRLVTWDVSAKDWVESDSEALARHILAKVRPGSVILLHDSIDGEPGADRSVVVRALPAILEGLKAKGLTPVTLDKLLGTEPYLAECR